MDQARAALLRRYLALIASLSGDDDQAAGVERKQTELPPPDTSIIKEHEIGQEIAIDTGNKAGGAMTSMFDALRQRELKTQRSSGDGRTAPTQNVHLSQRLLPAARRAPAALMYDSRVFCGKFNRDGRVFMAATQDQHLRLYRAADSPLERKRPRPRPRPPRGSSGGGAGSRRRGGGSDDDDDDDARDDDEDDDQRGGGEGAEWKAFKDVQCRHVGWSVVDVDFSPDSRFAIYSTWSPFVQLCNVSGEYELHEQLDFKPDARRFCLFSIRFSPDQREVLGGSSDHCLYLYDIERKERLHCVRAHDDDINTVAFADAGSQVFLTGSDDTLCKVWDRRLLGNTSSAVGDSGSSSSSGGGGGGSGIGAAAGDAKRATSVHQKPVGVFEGHSDGITHIDAKGDGKYFISNGKDQTLKLWDIRKMKEYKAGMGLSRSQRNWDYRMEDYPDEAPAERKGGGDCSIMTYRGHKVLETLIRCYFSPAATTGQRYIYTGSQSGVVHIYDVLTGKIVAKMAGHTGTVRDVSWHPTEPLLLSSSWDETVLRWEFRPERMEEEDTEVPAAAASSTSSASATPAAAPASSS